MNENIIYVTIISSEDRDGYCYERMYINDKSQISVSPLCECPEDAIIGRDLISCGEIADLMCDAVQWGIEGKKIIFNYEEVEDVYDFSIKEYLNSK